MAQRQFGLFQDLPLLRLISFNRDLPKRELVDQDSLSYMKSSSTHLFDCCVTHGYKLNTGVTNFILVDNHFESSLTDPLADALDSIDHSDDIQQINSSKLFQYHEILNFQDFYRIQYNPMDQATTQFKVDKIINDKASDLMADCIQNFETT